MNISKNNIRKAQLIMLKTLINVDNICKNHNLKYWLDFGTLLGAVRHKGFIPWDDDLDISMPRDDYAFFLKVAKSELSDEFFLQTIKTNPKYNLYHRPCKLRVNNTVLIEKGEGVNEYHQGIFIDIFPFDKYPESKFKRVFLKKIIWCLNIVQSFKFKTIKSNKRIMKLITIFFMFFINMKLLLLLTEGIIKTINKKKEKFIYGHGIETSLSFVFKKEEILPLKKLEFEKYDFYVPNKYEDYLRRIYGESYTELPPENERKAHSVKIATGDINEF